MAENFLKLKRNRYPRTRSISSIQSLSHVWLFEMPWIAACQASLSITNSWSLLKLMPIESVMLSSHLILCCPLLLLPSTLPASGSFPMNQLFAWGGPSIGIPASASFVSMNTQDLSPSGWTDWISLQSKGLSRVFSNTTVQKHQFFGTQLSSQSKSHPYMTTGKTIALTRHIKHLINISWASLMAQTVKNLPTKQEIWVQGLGRSPEEGNGYPLQYSCLENPTDGGAWQPTVHRVTRVGHNLAT